MLIEVGTLSAEQTYTFDGNSITVPPQSAAVNSELATLAYRGAQRAFERSVISLGAPAPSGTTSLGATECTAPDGYTKDAPGSALAGVGLSIGDALAHYATEALLLAREAAELTETTSLAASDARYSNATSVQLARAYSLNLPFASRGAAARIWSGGHMGMHAFNPQPFDPLTPDIRFASGSANAVFTNESLTTEGRSALRFLRMAAPNPADVMNPAMGLDALMSGDWQQRLADVLRDETLREQTTASGVYEYLGLSQRGFVQARAFIAEEIHIYNRSRSQTIAESRLQGGRVAYASTRTDMQPPLRSWWTAQLRMAHPVTAPAAVWPTIGVMGRADLADPA